MAESRSEKNSSISGLAFPQRELPNPRGDPLHHFVALVKTFNEFLFELDADGKFLSIWTSNDALLQERRAEFLGRHALEILGEEIFHPFSELFRRVIKQGVCEDIVFPVDFPTGTRWFQARVSAVGARRTEGRTPFVCWCATSPQRRLAEESLRQHQALLGHAERVTGIGCWGYDVESHQHIWSEHLFRLYGCDPANGVPSEEMQRRPCWMPTIANGSSEFCERQWSFAPRSNTRAAYNLPDGRQRIIYVRGNALPDQSGKTQRLLAAVQDVTELRRTEAQARERESLLAQAEQLARMGSWKFDVARQSFAWSEQMYRMFGLKPDDEPVPLARACALFHPDDRARVVQEVANLIEFAQPLENEVRFVLPDGKIRVFHSRAVPILSQSGEVVRIAGMSQDVTEQKQAQDQLRKSESLLAQAEEIAKLGSWEMDTIHSTLTGSLEFFRILGLEPRAGPVPLEDWWAMIRLEDLAASKQVVQHAVASNTPSNMFRVTPCRMAVCVSSTLARSL